MTGRYKAYPVYKDSEIEWLGNVPNSWKLSRLGGMFEERREKVSDKDFSALSVTQDGIVPQLENAAKTDAGDNRKKVCINDFVINSRSDRKGSSGTSKLSGSVSLISIVLTPRNINPNFAHHLLRSYPFQNEFYRYGKGIHADLWSTNYSEMKNIILALPDDIEQQKIANFLDHETAKIDTLITKQEKLIELLKEKRQAVISHAVTKGLNPNAPMKDSGVEWLGEVPEHWRVSKLKWKTPTTSGGTPTTSKYEMYYQDGHIPWVRTTDLNNGKLLETPVHITPKALADTACSILPKNSVLLAMYGGAGSIGKHSLLMFEATINQAVCGIYPSSAFESEFLHYFYEFYRPFWMINAAGTRKDPNIGQDHIKEGKVVLPPLAEQRTIVAHINKTIALLDRLNNKATDAIELAKERKTALISATVTGKIDVRDWQEPTEQQG